MQTDGLHWSQRVFTSGRCLSVSMSVWDREHNASLWLYCSNDTLPAIKTLKHDIPKPCLTTFYSYPTATEVFTCAIDMIAAVTCSKCVCVCVCVCVCPPLPLAAFDLSAKQFSAGNEVTCQQSPPSERLIIIINYLLLILCYSFC